MAEFIIKIDFQSSIITPMHADTLWGHICWALRYLYGKKELLNFLAAYDGHDVPLVLSNALPRGCLPNPVLPPLSQTDRMDLLHRYWGQKSFAIGTAMIKALSELQAIPTDVLARTIDGPLSTCGLIQTILSSPDICAITAEIMESPCPSKYGPDGEIICHRWKEGYPFPYAACPNPVSQKTGPAKAIIFHTAISRLTGSALDGQLFTTLESECDRRAHEVHCKINDPFTPEKMHACLEYINQTGFGKKKSTGKGRIHCELKDASPLSPQPRANAFMTLSNFIPKNGDPLDGNYRLITKYGKLGGHYASSPIDGYSEVVPFKYPLVMFTAGSIFRTQGNLKPHYGSMLRKVHPQMDSISHYALSYPYPLWIEV